MFRRLSYLASATLVTLFLAGGTSHAQSDSLTVGMKAVLDSMVSGYAKNITFETIDIKEGECDFMISSASEALPIQSHIAKTLFNYYRESIVMGEEEVAIYIYDKWFAKGPLEFEGDLESIDAQLFVEFNRSTQIGMEAPLISLRDTSGHTVQAPVKGVVSVLFFYEIGCSKCMATCRLLPSVMNGVETDINFYAVYVGSETPRWKAFARDNFNFDNENVKVFNLMADEDLDCDVNRLYGVLSTPRMYLTDPNGIIFGRRLELDSLAELLRYAPVLNAAY